LPGGTYVCHRRYVATASVTSDKYAVCRLHDAFAPPATAGGGPAPGGTCMRRPRRVAIAANQARPVPLARQRRGSLHAARETQPPPQHRPALGQRRVAHMCAAIAASRSQRDELAPCRWSNATALPRLSRQRACAGRPKCGPHPAHRVRSTSPCRSRAATALASHGWGMPATDDPNMGLTRHRGHLLASPGELMGSVTECPESVYAPTVPWRHPCSPAHHQGISSRARSRVLMQPDSCCSPTAATASPRRRPERRRRRPEVACIPASCVAGDPRRLAAGRPACRRRRHRR
jgi:hypothetical protein